MDDAPMDAGARRLFDRLAEVANAIEAERTRHEAATRPLLAERNQLWHELTARGYSRRDLATVAKVTPMSVQAVIKGRPSRERRRKGTGRAASPSNSDTGSGTDATP